MNGRIDGTALVDPDWDPHLTIAQLSLPHLTAHGLKAAVIDVDRTLLPGRDVTLPGPVRDWLVDAGRRLQLHLFSNNPSRDRIAAVADQLQVSFTFGAGKPRRGALRSVVRDLALPPEAIAMIGDRLFTDVLCGNRMGLYTCWCARFETTASPAAMTGCSGLNAPWPA